MHQRDYSESELEEVTDFDEQTTAYSTPRQRNPFIEIEAKEDSLPDFDSEYDVTINPSPLIDLSPLRSPSLLDVSQPKRRRVVIISSDTELYLIVRKDLRQTCKPFSANYENKVLKCFSFT